MRRNRPKRREILPDVRYGNLVVAKFINNIMRRGKKSLAQRLFYTSLAIIEERTKQEPIKVFEKAIQNSLDMVYGERSISVR